MDYATVGSVFLLCFVFVPMMFLWAVTLFDIAVRRLSGAAKIGWILLVLFVPLLGVVAYYTLGRRRGEPEPLELSTNPNADFQSLYEHGVPSLEELERR